MSSDKRDRPEREFSAGGVLVKRIRGRVMVAAIRPQGKPAGTWALPKGNLDPGERPDETARREVLEETGVAARLLGTPDQPADLPRPGEPRRLALPAGVQLAAISPGHEHIDFVYFATGRPAPSRAGVGWYGPSELGPLGLTAEIAGWCAAAVAAVAAHMRAPEAG
jgi:8-oxo-dGTP pyrophosphatase MutT (NUDIX family)